MDIVESFTGLIAVILALGIPICAIICACIIAMRKKKYETELRKSIVENHVDAETAKVLVKQQEQKMSQKSQSRPYILLRIACGLTGIGMGMYLQQSISLDAGGRNGIVFLSFGLGLLVAFIVEMLMERKKKKPEEEIEVPETSLNEIEKTSETE